ncbi:replicative DNA helicase [Pacificimonas flava]|uniref:Replicative DNA helicase n=2 Tax=Pacificimonas TaxID=1960290 RepID=A0A219B859_9SPHN|nr:MULTISPECIES: replicative DNA helicase [Pacificimonas]MBZ6378169.1 replicative DNA helicase [Pacificimonas aurantium]OWV34572.1 replicative DNA helicase [Pacificimonas flava]
MASNPVSLFAESTGHELPQNLDAEAALLGAIMLDNRLAEDVQMKLRPEHFFEPLHARIYEQILKLIDRGMLANPVTLRPTFKDDPALKELGGPAYLNAMTEQTAGLIAARDFAQQIYDLALLRALVSVGREMVESASDTSEDVDPQRKIEDAEMALYRVAEEGDATGQVRQFKTAATQALEMVNAALKSGGNLSGLTTGLDGLNSKTGGMHRSDLVILAGRPAMGKTALATNIAFACAERFMKDREGDDPDKSSGRPVGFFSLEMSADQLATRILAEQAEVNSEDLRMGRISQEDFRRLTRASAKLESLPLLIDDTPGLSIAALRSRARRMKRQHGVGMIVVDYLQLLQGTNRKSAENRVQEISEITRGLKTLAKELNVPVLALSQLSRQVEQREDKRPQLADLRESGTIEQDADIVMFVYREEYYHAAKKPEDGSEKFSQWLEKAEAIRGHAEVIVAKQRHGATGIVPLMFQANVTRFRDRAPDGYAESYE